LTYFLYQGLGRLFLEKSEYSRCLVVVAHAWNFEALDAEKEITWAGRKGMQTGGLVFVYRATPRKAITDIFQDSKR
jgi:hypothetical protein